MFRRLVDWTISLINVSRELAEHREAIYEWKTRTRDLEEAFKMLSQEIRHLREMEASEREKIVLRIESILAKSAPHLPPKRRGNTE